MDRWYEDHGKLSAFIHMLADNGMTAKELAYVVEKPWKWTAERDAWSALGCPDVVDLDELSKSEVA